MRMSRRKFRKMFPSLAEELGAGANSVRVTSVRSDAKVGEAAASVKFHGYSPDVIDFLRRCETEEEGQEIISYLEKRSEIDGEYAEHLRTQLRTKGIRSFGLKKGEDYYLKEASCG